MSHRYSHLSTSRVAGNAQTFLFTIILSRIRTYPPREGPETSSVVSKFLYALNRIRTYLPREGPETLLHYQSLQTGFPLCIRTYPPREGPETRQLCRQSHRLYP